MAARSKGRILTGSDHDGCQALPTEILRSGIFKGRWPMRVCVRFMVSILFAVSNAAVATAGAPDDGKADAAALDHSLMTFQSEYQLGGEPSEVRIISSRTQDCVTRLQTKGGPKSIDWEKVTRIQPPGLFNFDYIIHTDRGELYIGAPSAETEDGQPFEREIEDFMLAAYKYHQTCRK